MAKKVLNGLDLSNQKIVSLADPSANTDAANKQYVDQVARGLNWKQAVRVATTTNGTMATAYDDASVIDGITLATGDRILIKDQTTASENGIYVVAASGAPTRATDMPAGSDGKGVAVSVTSGTVNADRVYIQTADTAVVGTNNLTWSQLGGGGTAYTAGSGLTESPAGTFNVGAGNGITVNADDVALASSAGGAGLTYTTGVLAVGAGNGITVNADDVALASSTGGAGLTYTTGVLAVGAGTGISVAADAVSVDTAVVARKEIFSVGNGSLTTIDLTLAFLNSRDVVVEVYRNSTPWDTVLVDVERPAATTVRLNFATAPTSSEFKAVVIG